MTGLNSFSETKLTQSLLLIPEHSLTLYGASLGIQIKK